MLFYGNIFNENAPAWNIQVKKIGMQLTENLRKLTHNNLKSCLYIF